MKQRYGAVVLPFWVYCWTKIQIMFQGVLTKMQTEFKSPVDYYLVFKDSFVHVNRFLEKKVHIIVWALSI